MKKHGTSDIYCIHGRNGKCMQSLGRKSKREGPGVDGEQYKMDLESRMGAWDLN
jgi:hypothetical protein